MEPIVDLRSDTLTRPTPGMRAAMQAAEVGDDVFHEDPTVNRLEQRVAQLLGKEAALFVPSGTMSNQVAVKAHTQPGDELLCDVDCHIYNYEAGGPAVLSGVTCFTLPGDFGVLDVTQLEERIRPVNDHLVRTRLVCLENTHNRGGGRVYPLEKIQAIRSWTRQNGLILHLDGARLWNAVVATGIAPARWAEPCDSVSVCFSKGLGAPVGSALTGSAAFITRAAPGPQALWRRHAPGRRPGRGRPLRPRSPHRTPHRRPSPCPGDRPGHRRHSRVCASIRRTLTRTWSFSRSIRTWEPRRTWSRP